MEAGASHEIGVWVSGFYGSGKSSFTKYLGLAFDERTAIDGRPFLRYLQDRLHRPTTKALLAKLIEYYLPGRRLAKALSTIKNHDDRAAVVCALTALGVAAGHYVAVGDKGDGWIVFSMARSMFLPASKRVRIWGHGVS